MITIIVTPAKRRFRRRKQWKFAVTTGNNQPIDPRDTYANVGDIRDIWDRIVRSGERVELVVHYQSGPRTTVLRGGSAVLDGYVAVQPDTEGFQAAPRQHQEQQEQMRKGHLR